MMMGKDYDSSSLGKDEQQPSQWLETAFFLAETSMRQIAIQNGWPYNRDGLDLLYVLGGWSAISAMLQLCAATPNLHSVHTNFVVQTLQ
jgi:hypothetical protein